MPETALVKASHLSKRFVVDRDLLGHPTRWRVAVDNVTLEIMPGETVGLVGESGCGKSTLGRLLIGLTPATSGSVHFDGIDVFDSSAKEVQGLRHRAQIVFQDPFSSLDPRMRVGSIVAEGMRHLHLSRAERENRVASLLELVHLPAAAMRRYPHEFSGGQRQRVGIARALAVNPDFLVADEPVSALDVSVQSSVLNLLADLRERLKLTLLFISHDTSVIRYIADRAAVMYLGRIVEIGPTESVFGDPRHPYTQALLSSVPRMVRPQQFSKRIILQGDIPTAIEPGAPPGCKFASRCARVLPHCSEVVPPLDEVSADHRLACFNPSSIEAVAGADRN